MKFQCGVRFGMTFFLRLEDTVIAKCILMTSMQL
jgi:hypothetical protein